MDKESIAPRRTAFDKLLRDVAKKLSTQDQNGIEVSEEVPDKWREKGGIKLLEYLQRQGKFSVWRTSRLRNILKECERHDLAENEVKHFQLSFPDIDSPAQMRRSSTNGNRNLLPSLSSHPHRPSSSPPILRHPHRPLNPLPMSPSPLQEVQSSQSSLDWRVGSFPSTPLSSRSTASSSSRRSMTADNSPLPPTASRPGHVCSLQLESSRMAIEALRQIAMTGSQSSIHSYEEGFSVREETKQGHSASLPLDTEYPDEDDDECNQTWTATTFGRFIPLPSSASETNIEHSQPTTDGVFPPSKQDDCHAPPPPIPAPSSKPHIYGAIISPLNYPTPSPAADIIWQVKRERLLKSLSKSSERKPHSISCGQKIDIELGHGKNNPKLSIVLYPFGLFENEGKSASLQIKISVPEKCPPLPPSIQLQLKLIVYSSHKREVLREATIRECINLHSMYIHHLFNCSISLEAIGEYILIEIFCCKCRKVE